MSVATATEVAYRFDGTLYAATEQGKQELLEAIDEALNTEAWNDSELSTEDERQEAVSMSYDGTHYAADFWDNIMAIMQHAPYDVSVTRLDRDQLTEDELEWL
jgi:predicted nucleic acid-binding protein